MKAITAAMITGPVLTDDELTRLLMLFLRPLHPDGGTEDDCCAVVQRAEDTRINAALLSRVFAGDVIVSVANGECLFRLATDDERRAAQEVLEAATDER